MKTRSGPRAAPAKAPLQGSGSNQVLRWWVLIDPIKLCTWWEGHGHPVPPAPPGTTPGPPGSATASWHQDSVVPRVPRARLCRELSASTGSSCAGDGIMVSHFTGTEGFSSLDANGVPHSQHHSQPHSWHHPFLAPNKLLFCMR